MNKIDYVFEKLKQLKDNRSDNVTFIDAFDQRATIYNEEDCNTSIILGLEFAMLWKTFDELIKQINEVTATLTKGEKNEQKNNSNNERL